MRVFLLYLLLALTSSELYSQTDEKAETIPLQKKIDVQILNIDSATLGLYNLYEFSLQQEDKKIEARFWASKSDTIFQLGAATVELCRITQMRTEQGINYRGCAFYNGFIIEYDSTEVKFDFDEFGESPTLRLCSTD